VEQIDYNLLFRWFIELPMDQKVWDHSVFTKNRDRLLNTEIARAFFGSVREQVENAKLLSDEHFTVDGTLVKAWTYMKSFRSKDDSGSSSSGNRNPEVDFRGEKRTKDTDPDARLYRKARGQESRLCFTEALLLIGGQPGIPAMMSVRRSENESKKSSDKQHRPAFKRTKVSQAELFH